ncbi:MAG: sulfurtransferase-like selenium metabolism protein YedF [Nitrospirae bacterium]|nr:sulfurtransferase-like selenium metabolism protein YedF [Nitrospirota bacterium]
MQIDARGLGCPKPVLLAEEALAGIDEGVVTILVDNEGSVKNLTRFASKNGFYSEDSKEDGYWKVRLVKGYPCDLPAGQAITGKTQEAVQESTHRTEEMQAKDVLLIVGSDTMGKDEALGKILMKGFLETIKVTREIPHTIFFLNAAVKLTTTNEEIIPILQDLEKIGVEIFSCGTCLKHYDLEKSLKVGFRGTTNHIVEGIKDFRKTVWIG